MWKKIHTARCKPLQSVGVPQGKKPTPHGQECCNLRVGKFAIFKLGVSFGRHREAWVVSQGFINRHTPWPWQHWDLGPKPKSGSLLLQNQLEIWRGSSGFTFWRHFFNSDTIYTLKIGPLDILALSRATWQMDFPICWGFGKQAKEILFPVGIRKKKKSRIVFGSFETFSIYSKHFIQISTPYNVIESRVYFKESNFAGRNQTSQWTYGNRPFES